MKYFLTTIFLFYSSLSFSNTCEQWEYSIFQIVRTENTSRAIWPEIGNNQEWDMLNTKDIQLMNKFFDLITFSHIYFLETIGKRGWELAASEQNHPIWDASQTINTMYFKKCK